MAQQKGIKHTMDYNDDFSEVVCVCVCVHTCICTHVCVYIHPLTDLGGTFRQLTLKEISSFKLTVVCSEK